MPEAERYKSPLSIFKDDRVEGVSNKKKYGKGACLICGKLINNPTVIKQNGYVFCYNCIWDYVRENGHCPITRISVRE